MDRNISFAKVGIFISLLAVMACGKDKDIIAQNQAENEHQIKNVLKQWQQAYATENLNKYMAAFWEEGFLYVTDWGTPDDKTDDVMIDDIGQERESMTRIFRIYEDIKMQLFLAPDISFNENNTRAEVRARYRVELTLSDGYSFEGGYSGTYAEGNFLFIFEKRNGEWRIAEWHEKGTPEDQLSIIYN